MNIYFFIATFCLYVMIFTLLLTLQWKYDRHKKWHHNHTIKHTFDPKNFHYSRPPLPPPSKEETIYAYIIYALSWIVFILGCFNLVSFINFWNLSSEIRFPIKKRILILLMFIIIGPIVLSMSFIIGKEYPNKEEDALHITQMIAFISLLLIIFQLLYLFTCPGWFLKFTRYKFILPFDDTITYQTLVRQHSDLLF